MHPGNPTRGALIAATVAVVAAAVYTVKSAVAAPGDSATEESAAVRDGSHDFDFVYGKWRMPNHRLKKRLAGSHEWVDFITCDEGRPLPGGIGDTDSWRASFWKDFVGIAFRTYDTKTGLWRIYWVDNTFSQGVIGPPLVGKFDGNVGKFEGRDTENGVPVLRSVHLDAESHAGTGVSAVGEGVEPRRGKGCGEVGAGILCGRRQDLGNKLVQRVHSRR